MRYFPQMAQYPIKQRRRLRTVINELADGRRIRLADATAGITEWVLHFGELTDGEAETLAAFFLESEGRLLGFTFLDPAGNLLRWSEKLDEAVWERDPLLGASSADGRIWLLQNQGAAAQAITQLVGAPAAYSYTLSLWARGSGEVTLICGQARRQLSMQAEWRRLVFPATEQAPGDGVRFGVEMPAGGSAELFGMQAEAQMGASGYKKTTARGGVYGNARFDQDALRMVAVGLERHECEVKIVHGDGF